MLLCVHVRSKTLKEPAGVDLAVHALPTGAVRAGVPADVRPRGITKRQSALRRVRYSTGVFFFLFLSFRSLVLGFEKIISLLTGSMPFPNL